MNEENDKLPEEVQEDSKEVEDTDGITSDLSDQENEGKNDEVLDESLDGTSSERIEASNNDESWESSLDEKLSGKEMKKLQKKKLKEKIKEKKNELNKKTTDIVEDKFLKVFDKKGRIYTIVFIIGAVLIGIFVSIPFDETVNFLGKEGITNFSQFMIITISFTMIIGFFFLFLLSRNKKLHEILFAEEKNGVKAVIIGISLGIGFVLCLLYWSFVDDIVGDELNYFQYQQLFGLLLIIVFFGWNIIQIVYVKNTIEKTAIGAEARFQISKELKSIKSRNRTSSIINLIFVIIPFVFLAIFLWLFIYFDTPRPYENLEEIPDFVQKFTPDDFFWNEWLAANPLGSDESKFVVFFSQYFTSIWWGTPALQGIIIWTIIVFGITIATSRNQLKLRKQSKVNESQNVYAAVFYLVFWFLLWIKLFLIINTYITIVTKPEEGEAKVVLLYQIFDWVTSILLMVITILNLVMGFGKKVKSVKSTKITKYNVAIILFIFVISYWGGQWSLISGGTSQNALNLGTNVIVACVYLGFYFWYSKWIAERRGFIRKTSYTTPETRKMLIELSQRYQNRLLQTIENEEIITNTLNEYMLEKKIVIKGGAEEDAIVGSLAEAEEEKLSAEKLKIVFNNLKEAGKEKALYEEIIEKLDNLKAGLETLFPSEKQAQSEVDLLGSTIESDFKSIDNTKTTKEKEIIEENAKLENLKQNFKGLEKPSESEPVLTEEGNVDEELTSKNKELYEEALKKYNSSKEQIESTENDISKMKSEIEGILLKWDEAKAKLNDAQIKRQNLKEIQQKIKDSERQIEALESDVETLKKRAEDAQPLLDAAKMQVKSAEIEMDGFKDLESAKNQETEAEEKLARAQVVYDNSLKDVSNAENVLSVLKSTEEIEGDIKHFQGLISTLEETVANSEKKLEEKQRILEEKGLGLTDAKAETKNAKGVLNQAEKVLIDIQKDYKHAKSTFEKAETLKEKLDTAKDSLEEAKAFQSEIINISEAEKKINENSNRLKEQKSKLKDLKKQEPMDQAEIDQTLDAINTNEVKLKQYNAELKDAKTAKSKVDKAQKLFTHLEHEQLDLPALQQELESNENKMQDATNALDNPQNVYDGKQDAQTLAQDEFDISTKDVKLAQKDLTDDQIELKNANDDKSNAEQSLNDRQNAELALKKSKEKLTETTEILNKAKDNYTGVQEFRSEQEKIFNLKDEAAVLDRTIYLSYKALKKAHKTFKQAVQSAEHNLRSCEARVEEAKQNKISILESRDNTE